MPLPLLLPQARLHISQWGMRPESLQAFLRDAPPGAGWTHVLGVRPTGEARRGCAECCRVAQVHARDSHAMPCHDGPSTATN